jgi:hypothetical protein
MKARGVDGKEVSGSRQSESCRPSRISWDLFGSAFAPIFG